MIKGIPIVPDSTNLIVSHTSLEVTDIQATLEELIQLGISYEQNISVPKGKGQFDYWLATKYRCHGHLFLVSHFLVVTTPTPTPPPLIELR
jgi:hypothetical protein